MIVIDTNVVVILEKRSKLPAVLVYLRQNRDEEIAISTLTLRNVFYLLESHKLDVLSAEPLLRSYKLFRSRLKMRTGRLVIIKVLILKMHYKLPLHGVKHVPRLSPSTSSW